MSEESASAQFEWSDKVERFELLNSYWCVRTAKHFIRTRPREVRMLDVGDVRGFIGLVVVDREREWEEVDTEVPLVVSPWRGTHMIIDGWHRVYKALESGIGKLPCVVLTEEEAEECFNV